MIARLLAFLAILYGLGFALFAVTLGEPADTGTPKVDAIIAITGGKGRIEHGARLLAEGKARRLLIAGADPSVRKDDMVRRLGAPRQLLDCCVDLGSESVDTRSNAEEAKRWLDRRHYQSVRLVTSDSSDEASIGFWPKIAAVFSAIASTVFEKPSLNFLKSPNMSEVASSE